MTVRAVRSPRPRWRVAEIIHSHAGIGQSFDESGGAERGGCLVLSDTAGAGPRWNPNEGDLSCHTALAPRVFLRAYLLCQTPHTRPRGEPFAVVLDVASRVTLRLMSPEG
jgi:hypothetical protein